MQRTGCQALYSSARIYLIIEWSTLADCLTYNKTEGATYVFVEAVVQQVFPVFAVRREDASWMQGLLHWGRWPQTL